MANKKYVMLDMNDPRMNDLADMLSNKTSKKIIEFIADKEASESEIANELKLPANTVNYNIKKLLEVGLVERTGNFFWSVKGRKILKYRAANKKIVISPRSFGNVKQVLGTLGISVIMTYALKVYYDNYLVKNLVKSSQTLTKEYDLANAESASGIASSATSQVSNIIEIWPWFLAGAVFALIIYFLIGKIFRK